MQRLELLKQLSFGAQIAEDEVQDLANYFVETHQWDQISRGKIDIVRGEKGAGKSAIYSLLTTKVEEFFDRGILLVAAERPRGATVFKDLVADPPTDEQEFISLWKIYILTIVAQKLREYDLGGAHANKLYGPLEEAKLLERGMDLPALLRRSQHFVRYLRRLELQAGLEFDSATGAPSAYVGKITLKEPEFRLREQGFNSVDDLFKHANAALGEHNYNVWVLLDRLDVAFADNHKLEANALRALLRVYGDMRAFDRISLKIFLREDIWKRIFEKGFREASHITDMVVLEWSTSALQNLVVRRLLSNQILLDQFGIDRRAVLGDTQAQDDMVKRFFPNLGS